MRAAILFMTSNGAGLGHLTRSMAIARRLPEGIEPVFFTLSQALPVVRRQGFRTEFLYSPGYAGTDRSAWNRLYERRIHVLLEQYDPAVVLFDGSYPYQGLVNVAAVERSRAFVWCRRALWKRDAGRANLRRAVLFDGILEPGELAGGSDRGLTTAVQEAVTGVPPVLLCDEDELLPAGEAIQELGLDEHRLRVLVQLGAGNINDISTEVGMILARLRGEPGVQVVVAQSTIAGALLELPRDVKGVRRYPLAPFSRAFDFVVSAAGYNSFHEHMGYGLPGLFVPNTDTALDDQVARARHAESTGGGRSWWGKDPSLLNACLTDFLDEGTRAVMRASAEEQRFPNGAHVAADALADLVRRRMKPGGSGAGLVPTGSWRAADTPAPAHGRRTFRPVHGEAPERGGKRWGGLWSVVDRLPPHWQRQLWRVRGTARSRRHAAKAWLAHKFVEAAMPLPRAKGSGATTVMLIAEDMPAEILERRLDEIHLIRDELQGLDVVVVTSSDAFHLLRAHEVVFEYLPSPEDAVPTGAAVGARRRRMDELVVAYRPDRVVALSENDDDLPAVLRSLARAPRVQLSPDRS